MAWCALLLLLLQWLDPSCKCLPHQELLLLELLLCHCHLLLLWRPARADNCRCICCPGQSHLLQQCCLLWVHSARLLLLLCNLLLPLLQQHQLLHGSRIATGNSCPNIWRWMLLLLLPVSAQSTLLLLQLLLHSHLL